MSAPDSLRGFGHAFPVPGFGDDSCFAGRRSWAVGSAPPNFALAVVFAWCWERKGIARTWPGSRYHVFAELVVLPAMSASLFLRQEVGFTSEIF